MVLLRFGIPDCSTNRTSIVGLEQLAAEGAVIVTNTLVGEMPGQQGYQLGNFFRVAAAVAGRIRCRAVDWWRRAIAVTCLCRAANSVAFILRWEFLPQQNRLNSGVKMPEQIRADGKHVIVIGGGDTGSDCGNFQPPRR